jgi:tRNA(Glu) U13 pseudouridine synthase TruD
MQTQLPDLSGSFAPDELTPGQLKWTLRFQLPRGCYATMVIKHLLACVRDVCLSPLSLPADE